MLFAQAREVLQEESNVQPVVSGNSNQSRAYLSYLTNRNAR
jgi:hypothetical protein